MSKANKRIYLLDTNVILSSPNSISSFKEHTVVIPTVVLDELDNIKESHREVSKEARTAINRINDILGNATAEGIAEGVDIPDSTPLNEEKGKLSIFISNDLDANKLCGISDNNRNGQNDNLIIASAIHLQQVHSDQEVVLVTKDISMRLIAKGLGVKHVEDYRNDVAIDDVDYMSSGYHHIEGDFWDNVDAVETVHERDHTIHRIQNTFMHKIHLNQFVLDDRDFLGLIDHIEGDIVSIIDIGKDRAMNQNFWGIQPRNLEQAMAMFLLADDETDLKVLTGSAGSGKTMLAMAYALHAALDKKQYSTIIFARNKSLLDEDIGYLPGEEATKAGIYLGACEDALSFMHENDESPTGSVEYVMEKANIQFKSIAFMQGRSFQNTLLIIDEAQGLTRNQLRALTTRIGVGSDMILMGSVGQVATDYCSSVNRFVTPLTSGLTHAVEKSKNFRHAGVVHLQGVQRSRLAEFAEENF